MSEIVYKSNVRIEHLGVPFNRAYLPATKEPVLFGVHGKVAEHYKIPLDKIVPCNTTLDYIVASAGGCLTGTFAGILKARKVTLGSDGISADVCGEIERESNNVLVIKRIHVVYHLSTSPDEKDKVFQLHEMHAEKCPVYRSLTPGIAIMTELDWHETK
jgi:uncharacterized OsmC-like protein